MPPELRNPDHHTLPKVVKREWMGEYFCHEQGRSFYTRHEPDYCPYCGDDIVVEADS